MPAMRATVRTAVATAMLVMLVHAGAMLSELVEHVNLLKIYRNKIYLKPLT
jgi:hypothetical protein